MGPGLGPDAPYLEELQRLYGSLAVGALPPGMTPIPNVFPPPNIGVDVVQRERERLGSVILLNLISELRWWLKLMFTRHHHHHHCHPLQFITSTTGCWE